MALCLNHGKYEMYSCTRVAQCIFACLLANCLQVEDEKLHRIKFNQIHAALVFILLDLWEICASLHLFFGGFMRYMLFYGNIF